MSFESVPIFGLMCGFGFFCLFAYRTPLTSNLYKESLYSLALGLSVAALQPVYYRKLYYERVTVAYDKLQLRF